MYSYASPFYLKNAGLSELNGNLSGLSTPAQLNSTVDISTGIVNLVSPMNNYYFFIFIWAAGNYISSGVVYSTNIVQGALYNVPCGKGHLSVVINSQTQINITENTSEYNFRYILAISK